MLKKKTKQNTTSHCSCIRENRNWPQLWLIYVFTWLGHRVAIYLTKPPSDVWGRLFLDDISMWVNRLLSLVWVDLLQWVKELNRTKSSWGKRELLQPKSQELGHQSFPALELNRNTGSPLGFKIAGFALNTPSVSLVLIVLGLGMWLYHVLPLISSWPSTDLEILNPNSSRVNHFLFNKSSFSFSVLVLCPLFPQLSIFLENPK